MASEAGTENLEVKSEEPGAAELDVGKRARPEEEGASVDEEQDAKRSRPADLKAYLKKLLEEESKILPFASVLPECTRLLQQEIAQARLGKAVPSATGFVAASPKYTHAVSPYLGSNALSVSADLEVEMIENREIGPGSCKSSFKIFVPVERAPGFNFIGRLLGPRGNTLKDMQNQSGCKMTIRGKGSMKLKNGETDTELAKQPQHAHLLEPLHVVVEWEGPIATKDRALAKAQSLIEEHCVPPSSDDADRIKKHQLRELALLNGTFKDDSYGRQRGLGARQHQAPAPYNPAPMAGGMDMSSGVDMTNPMFQQAAAFAMAQQAMQYPTMQAQGYPNMAQQQQAQYYQQY